MRIGCSKYRSRVIPALRMLFLTMKTGTLLYFGMTTGRITPDLVKIMWSPSSRTQINPSRSNMHARILYETGLSLRMNQGERDSDSLGINEPGSNESLIMA
jgi:hypothetical protein